MSAFVESGLSDASCGEPRTGCGSTEKDAKNIGSPLEEHKPTGDVRPPESVNSGQSPSAKLLKLPKLQRPSPSFGSFGRSDASDGAPHAQPKTLALSVWGDLGEETGLQAGRGGAMSAQAKPPIRVE